MKRGILKSTLKSTIKRRNFEDSITDILEKSEKPLSTAEIASQLNKSWHTIIRYCLDLEIQGKIFKFEIGRVSAWQMKK
jgi:response regulator of citrate/malate metabolism